MKLSKVKNRISGTLRGLSSQEYYILTNLKNPIAATKQFLGEELFKKFDRGKPLNDDQMDQVEDALNQVVFEKTKSIIPYATPIVRVKLDYSTSRTKAVYSFAGIDIFRLKKIKTPDGAGYLVCTTKIKHGNCEGQVLYSKHAIDRLIERTDLLEVCKKNTSIIVRAMQKTVNDATIELGNVGPQLKCGPFGFFPMVWNPEIGMWILTTFLEKEMKGSATDIKRKLKIAWEELSSKYDVQGNLPD